MPDNMTAQIPNPNSNVIAMSAHRPDARFSHISQVEGYWHALRGARAVPRRAEVDPRGIARALERAFILEQMAPGVGRLRIAGTHLADILGMEVRGMPLTAFFMPEARNDLSACLDQVCSTPSVMTLSLMADTGIGKPPFEARMLLLPLRDEAGVINRVLGCLDSSGLIGRAPRRFTITSRRVTALRGGDLAQAPAVMSPPVEAANPLRGFGESQSPFTGAPSKQNAHVGAGSAGQGQIRQGQIRQGQIRQAHGLDQGPMDGPPSGRPHHLRLVRSDR
ncbi:MAG: PAS domain-containing protein [Rhodobacterales bacterium]